MSTRPWRVEGSTLTTMASSCVPFSRCFPPEIRAEIIDFLDHHDLFAYSLASGQFNRESQRLIWRHIRLRFHLTVADINDNCGPLLRSPERGQYVRSLHIVAVTKDDINPRIPVSTPDLMHTLMRLLATIDAVHTLRLDLPAQADSVAQAVTLLSCLRTWMEVLPLEAFYCSSFLPLSHFIPLLNVVPSLSTLSLDVEYPPQSQTHSHASNHALLPPLTLPNLTTLHGRIDTVARIAPGKPVVKLQVHIWCSSYPRALGDTLERLGTTQSLPVASRFCIPGVVLGRAPLVAGLCFSMVDYGELFHLDFLRNWMQTLLTEELPGTIDTLPSLEVYIAEIHSNVRSEPFMQVMREDFLPLFNTTFGPRPHGETFRRLQFQWTSTMFSLMQVWRVSKQKDGSWILDHRIFRLR